MPTYYRTVEVAARTAALFDGFHAYNTATSVRFETGFSPGGAVAVPSPLADVSTRLAQMKLASVGRTIDQVRSSFHSLVAVQVTQAVIT